MFQNLRKICSKYPITASYIAVAVGLFLAVQVYRIKQGTPADSVFDTALWKLGAVQPLVFVYDHPLIKEDDFPTGGPFDLWAGEWWRILVSGFHHGDLLHLLMNCIAIGYLGRLIEPRMRSWLYAAFLILATFISLLPEYYFDHYPVGLSGGAFAMFGLLMMFRKIDPDLAEEFTEREITWGLGWLILCFVFTYLGILHIANAAHVSGFLYGLLAGAVLINRSRYAGLLRVSFVFAQLLLIPCTYLICHPVWNGKYYWYLARHEDDLTQRIEYLRKGMELAPGEPKIGAELALSLYRTEGEPFRSWEIILQLLKQNRSYDKGVEIARLIWKQFGSEQQKTKALEVVADVFGDESDAWFERLQLDQATIAQAEVPLPEVVDAPGSDLLFRKQTEPQTIRPRDLTAPPVDPRSPQSAAEGVSL
ncbi:rhomboid family intramembrane serine protease [Gimesia fumaroli]|uniref:Rhomboid protease GlpG n=1 Tax=Gimesia fumaroli TaxID=2527976 RepID=A0A518IEL7_9PLAN|nr:rhomboid family intramembrane serine protease [Gimesia fumaroli]QDV51507.1 Rhomboid protease GlpG [Gimesia fumaroli]